jgi:tungstate transport system ATP-binding protein
MDDALVKSSAQGSEPDHLLPLVLDGVSYCVGDSVLIEKTSLQITAGMRHLILGPNGAGKSLLLRLMHGLLAPSAGQVLWAKTSKVGRQAMVFQRPVLLRRSMLENIVFALQLNDSHLDVRRVAYQALERVGLTALAQRSARLCSIGEQQRLALARAWAMKPEILFLDEPSASLDPSATFQVEEIVNAMHAEGTTIVMASHDLAQARRLADRVIFMHRGQALEDSSARDFFGGPSTAVARAFLQGELVWSTP